jgi:YtcA-like protein
MFSSSKLSAKLAWLPLLLLLLLVTSGCNHAPSVSIVGSFFPVWILCIAAGIIIAVSVRALLLRTAFEKELKPAIVVYPCLAAGCAFTLWLLFFS